MALTVKVNKGAPTVSLKGTNALNLHAKDGERYVETSEMTMTVKNLPNTQKYLPGTEPSDKPDEGNTGDDGSQGGENQGGENQDGDNGSQGGGTTEGGTGTGNESIGSDQTQQPAMVSALAQAETVKTTYEATNPEFYSLNAEKTFKSILFTTKGYESKNPLEYFDFEWVEER